MAEFKMSVFLMNCCRERSFDKLVRKARAYHYISWECVIIVLGFIIWLLKKSFIAVVHPVSLMANHWQICL